MVSSPDINFYALEQMRLADVKVAQMKSVLCRCVDNMKMPVDRMEQQLDDIRDQLDAWSCLPTSPKAGATEVGEEDGMMLNIDDYEVLLSRVNVLKAHSAVHKMMVNRSGHVLYSSVEYSPESNHVHLKTVLAQQMQFVKALYGSVTVDLESVMLPKCIAGFVTTDRLWLAENVLSLLSNAAENATYATTTWAQSTQLQENIRVRCLLVNAVTLEAVPPTLTSLGDPSATCYNVRIEVDDDYIHVPETFQNEIFNGPDAIISSILSSHHEQSIDFAMALYAIRGRCNMLGGRCGVNDIVSRASMRPPAGNGYTQSGHDLETGDRGIERNRKPLGSCFWFEIPYIPYDNERSGGSVSGFSTGGYSKSSQQQRRGTLGGKESGRRRAERLASFCNRREFKESSAMSDDDNSSCVSDVTQSYSLLVIDSNALFLSKVANILETKRMRVTTALLGLQALKMVKRWGTRTDENYDAVLIGLGPPDNNRKQKLVISKVRERTTEIHMQRVGASTDSWNEANNNGLSINLRRVGSKHGGAVARTNQCIPIVAMIDDDDPGVVDDVATKEALSLGVDAVMRKSFKTEYLCGILATVIQQAFRTKAANHPDTHTGTKPTTNSSISHIPMSLSSTSATDLSPNRHTGSVDTLRPLDDSMHRNIGSDSVASFVRTVLLLLSNTQLIEAVASSPAHMIPMILHHLPREMDEATFIAIIKRLDPGSLVSIAPALTAARIPAVISLVPQSSIPIVMSKLPPSTIVELVPLLPNDHLEAVVPYVPNADSMILIASRLSPETLIAISQDLPQDYLVAIIASENPLPTDRVKAMMLASLPQERLGSLTSLLLALGPASHDLLLSVICAIEDANIVCHVVPLLPDILTEALIHKLSAQTLMLVMPRLKPHLVTMAYAVMRFG